MRNADALARDLARDAAQEGAGGRESAAFPPRAWLGVAPHSVRAVTAGYLREVTAFARARRLPLHMHVAEQPAEVEACRAETGRTPVALLADEGVLSPDFTGVHAVHVTADEAARMRGAGACVCACPTTERNLGDGVVPADIFFREGVPVALGTDSHAQIDLLEDARELEYHLRLGALRRNVLAPAGEAAGGWRAMSALAGRLFECATISGARSIGAPAPGFEPGGAADFFTVDLDDPSVAGASEEDLLPAVVFSLGRAAVRETAVGGRLVVEGGRHPAQDEIVSRFKSLQRRLWA
jgi:formimidoylglutamate deiminase